MPWTSVTFTTHSDNPNIGDGKAVYTANTNLEPLTYCQTVEKTPAGLAAFVEGAQETLSQLANHETDAQIGTQLLTLLNL